MRVRSSLPLPLRQELQRLGRARVQKTLDALARVQDEGETMPLCPVAEILAANPLEFPTRQARDAHVVIAHSPERLVWEEEAQSRLQVLHSCYHEAAALSAATAERQAWLVGLTVFTAGVMIPILARSGKYGAAVELADAHRHLVLSDAFADVAGAGSEMMDGERVPAVRLIMLSPVLWSLVGYSPASS